jgi:hypothetical protein
VTRFFLFETSFVLPSGCPHVSTGSWSVSKNEGSADRQSVNLVLSPIWVSATELPHSGFQWIKCHITFDPGKAARRSRSENPMGESPTRAGRRRTRTVPPRAKAAQSDGPRAAPTHSDTRLRYSSGQYDWRSLSKDDGQTALQTPIFAMLRQDERKASVLTLPFREFTSLIGRF